MADSEGIPHALKKAHAELVATLKEGIEQFNARLAYSNSREVCQCIERFVDELRRVPGAADELDCRKTLVLVRCRQGTRYRELMDRAFKSLRSVTKKKPHGPEPSSARAAARCLKPGNYMQLESQLTQEIGKIKWALRDGVIPVRCRKAFHEWLDECRRIASDAQSVEGDGCFYLSSVYHAWDSSATKMEVTAEELLKTSFGGANLESVRAAADSLVDWVKRNPPANGKQLGATTLATPPSKSEQWADSTGDESQHQEPVDKSRRPAASGLRAQWGKVARSGEPEDFSFDELNDALIGIQYLILQLDYEMWLRREFDSRLSKAQVSLIERPKSDMSKAIERYLEDRSEESRIRCLECRECGLLEDELDKKACKNCGNILTVLEYTDREILRFAAHQIHLEVAGMQAREVVPGWLVQELYLGRAAEIPPEILLPVSVVYQQLRSLFRKRRETYVGPCWRSLYIESRDQLVPAGATIEDQYRGYLVVREKLTAGYNFLTGIARRLPEFMDDYEQHTTIRRFPPALEPPELENATYLFRKVGANFKVRFEGETGDIPNSNRGAQYVHQLLQKPNTPIAAAKLRGSVESVESNAENDAADAKEQIEKIREEMNLLQRDIDKADKDRDQATKDRLSKDFSECVEGIKSLKGLGGRPRSSAKNPEQAARSAVTQSIATLRKNCRKKWALLRLAKHLEEHIDTGVDVTYKPPAPPPDWRFQKNLTCKAHPYSL